MELINIDESSNENAIVIFITKKDLKIPIIIILQRMTTEIALNYPILIILYIMILTNSWSHGG